MTTVRELQERVKDASGVDEQNQGRVLFGGKRLDPLDVLAEVGVEDGAQLNIVPASSSKKKASSTPAAVTTETSKDETAEAMKKYLQQSGVDPDKLDEMMKSMGAEGGVPSMEESMQAMSEMMNSPIFQEYLNDPEKLEQSRQMILNNPMLKSMMEGMPGMKDLLNDSAAWREAMQAAANLYKSMDSKQLSQMMNGMASQGQSGLFDGMFDNSAAAKALDELDEED